MSSRSVANNFIEQVEIFQRTPAGPSEYHRIGVFKLSADGSISLTDSNDQSLRGLLEFGVSPRDPHLENVLPSEGKRFLDAVVHHFQSASYYKVRRTGFVDVPNGQTSNELRHCLVLASTAVGTGRDLSAKAMEIDMPLAREIEEFTKHLETLRDQLHDAMLTDEDKANGAVPRSER